MQIELTDEEVAVMDRALTDADAVLASIGVVLAAGALTGDMNSFLQRRIVIGQIRLKLNGIPEEGGEG